MQGVKSRNDETKASFFTARPAASATLEMFPSWPMRFHQSSTGGNKSGGESSDSALSSKNENPFESESSQLSCKKASSFDEENLQLQQQNQSVTKEKLQKKGGGSASDKPLDAKTLRRLAQNREAARKSRLRKKAYVQQLESSRLKLAQLEQDLQRARSQGMFMDWNGGVGGNISSGGAMFDMEYGRWLEEDNRLLTELRNGLEAGLTDNEMRVMVDGYLCHYDQIFRVKSVTAKSDVFHLINGIWTSQAERCFLWIGGFRPSEIIMMLIQQLEPLAEQQIMGMYGLRHSSQQAEEALSQGLDQLQQSLVDTIAGGPLVDGVQQMVVAMGKLSNLEGFLRQADNLRQQTLHQLCRLLTLRQAARSFLVIGEYYGRLRALSSLWASRPRETMMSDDNSCQTTTDMQMVQPSQNHFSNF
ncbi:transcription factor TGA9-like isoform X3 [Trifolium pratense]|nr:transcription factor TGA9-like isoform X3 [Trifolium pratense]